MKVAIHQKKNDFSSKWIEYCQKKGIDYKTVNCYDNNIIEELQECDALMWHFNQAIPADYLFAKQLIFALEASGKKVFPNFHTAWHFDDKVAQKYLLEAVGAPLVPTYVFYDKKEALRWVDQATFPKVFKLRHGAGAAHVKLVENSKNARQIIHKAFGRGFSQYDKIANIKDRWYKFKNGNKGWWDVTKGVLRLGKTTQFAKIAGNERGYVYFQDFIPGNDYDIRVIVIGDKAFAIKRLVRDGDFRASGSGHILYGKDNFDEDTIRLSFEVARKINSQCLAIDYVFQDERSLIVEISYGFVKEPYYKCVGYWDRNLNWNPGFFDAQGWMVESVLEKVR